MSTFSEIQKLCSAAFCAIMLSACSAEQIFKDVSLNVAVSDGDIYTSLLTQIDSSNIQLLPTTIPILNPQNVSEQLGVVNISSSSVQITNVELNLNLSKVANIPNLTEESTLPNGTSFPMGNDMQTKWYSLPLGNSQYSKLYVNIDPSAQRSIVGYVLVSDTLAAGFVANLFTPIKIDEHTSFYGGIFSGVSAGTSGIAIFADFNSAPSVSTPTKQSIGAISRKANVVNNNLVDEIANSEANVEALQKRILKLNSKGAKIEFK